MAPLPYLLSLFLITFSVKNFGRLDESVLWYTQSRGGRGTHHAKGCEGLPSKGDFDGHFSGFCVYWAGDGSKTITPRTHALCRQTLAL